MDAELFERYHEPHRFVTMPAHEFGFRSGHKNVYPLDEADGPPRARDASELAQWCRGKRAIVISHHPNTCSETDPYIGWGHHNLDTIDPDVEPAIEICQDRGSFEHDQVGRDGVHFGGFGSSVQDALARGLRLGFVGGTDSHRARPGSARTNLSGLDADDFLGGGLTCVLAPELTREALFDALRTRRSYATTSVRILLDVRVNGHLMGSEIRGDGEPRTIVLRAAGTAGFARALVVRNGEEVHTQPGSGRLLDFAWRDEQPLEGSACYYVRLVQADGHMAWPSPVWVDT